MGSAKISTAGVASFPITGGTVTYYKPGSIKARQALSAQKQDQAVSSCTMSAAHCKPRLAAAT